MTTISTAARMYEHREHGDLLFRYGWTTRGDAIIEVKCRTRGAGSCKDVHTTILSATAMERYYSTPRSA